DRTMQLPRVRLTVQTMMVVIATLAVSWSMCFGTGHLTLLVANFRAVEHYTQEAILWEAEHNAAKAEDRRRMAERYALLNAESLDSVRTALSLIAFGVPREDSVLRPTRCIGDGIRHNRVGWTLSLTLAGLSAESCWLVWPWVLSLMWRSCCSCVLRVSDHL